MGLSTRRFVHLYFLRPIWLGLAALVVWLLNASYQLGEWVPSLTTHLQIFVTSLVGIMVLAGC